MKKLHPHRVMVALALLVVALSSQTLVGELTARLVESPESSGLRVSVDSVAVDGNGLSTIGLSVRNDSTNVLGLDITRSALLLADGTAYPLAAFAKSDLATALMPGNSASGTLGVSAPVQSGDRLKLLLAWTLGAVVGSGTWTWEIAEAAAPAPQPTAAPAPTPAAASATQPPVSADTSSDYIIGLVGVALGLVLLALLGWGLWSLVSGP
jgi:hypothetical protein